MSRNEYVELRDNLNGKPVILPSKHAIKDYLDEIGPPLTEHMDGVKGNFSDLLERSIQRILKSIDYQHEYQRLSIKLVTGFDGSGSHKQKGGKALKKGINTKNKILGKLP